MSSSQHRLLARSKQRLAGAEATPAADDVREQIGAALALPPAEGYPELLRLYRKELGRTRVMPPADPDTLQQLRRLPLTN